MTIRKGKVRVKKTYKLRAPHRPTQVHRDKKKYTRKGRAWRCRRKESLKEWQQMQEEHSVQENRDS